MMEPELAQTCGLLFYGFLAGAVATSIWYKGTLRAKQKGAEIPPVLAPLYMPSDPAKEEKANPARDRFVAKLAIRNLAEALEHANDPEGYHLAHQDIERWGNPNCVVCENWRWFQEFKKRRPDLAQERVAPPLEYDA